MAARLHREPVGELEQGETGLESVLVQQVVVRALSDEVAVLGEGVGLAVRPLMVG